MKNRLPNLTIYLKRIPFDANMMLPGSIRSWSKRKFWYSSTRISTAARVTRGGGQHRAHFSLIRPVRRCARVVPAAPHPAAECNHGKRILPLHLCTALKVREILCSGFHPLVAYALVEFRRLGHDYVQLGGRRCRASSRAVQYVQKSRDGEVVLLRGIALMSTTMSV